MVFSEFLAVGHVAGLPIEEAIPAIAPAVIAGATAMFVGVRAHLRLRVTRRGERKLSS